MLVPLKVVRTSSQVVILAILCASAPLIASAHPNHSRASANILIGDPTPSLTELTTTAKTEREAFEKLLALVDEWKALDLGKDPVAAKSKLKDITDRTLKATESKSLAEAITAHRKTYTDAATALSKAATAAETPAATTSTTVDPTSKATTTTVTTPAPDPALKPAKDEVALDALTTKRATTLGDDVIKTAFQKARVAADTSLAGAYDLITAGLSGTQLASIKLPEPADPAAGDKKDETDPKDTLNFDLADKIAGSLLKESDSIIDQISSSHDLDTLASNVAKALKDDAPDGSPEPDAKQPSSKKGADDAAVKISDAVPGLIGYLDRQTTAVNTNLQTLIGKLVKSDDVTSDAEVTILRSRKLFGEVEQISGNLAGWGKKLGDVLPDHNGFGSAGKKFAVLPNELDLMRGFLAIADDSLAGFTSGTQQEAIQLFYFGNVPEAMKALNLNASQYTDDFFKNLTDADTIRDALLKSEDDAQTASADINELVTKQNRLQAQLNNSFAELQQYASRTSTLNTQLQDIATARAAVPAGVNQAAQQKQFDDLATAVTARRDANQKEVDRLQGTAENTQGAIQANAASLKDAQASLATAIKNRNALQLSVSRQAAKEVDAFAEARDHHPFWYAMPVKTAQDPVHRCMIFGYDNSNVIFVRGAYQDVAVVKEILASFDRPVPQAQIGLYSLQINGSDPKRIAENIQAVGTELNTLQGNLTLIQDVLRNSVAREVARATRVAKLTLTPAKEPAPELSERVWRSFYYPREIRKTLGLEIQVGVPLSSGSVPQPGDSQDRRYLIASAIDDLEQGLDAFGKALEVQASISDYASATSRLNRVAPELKVKRSNLLTQTGYFIQKASAEIKAVLPNGFSNSYVQKSTSNMLLLGEYVTHLIRMGSDASDDLYSYALRVSRLSDIESSRVSSELASLSKLDEVAMLNAIHIKNPYDCKQSKDIFNDVSRVRDALRETLNGFNETPKITDDIAGDADAVTGYTLPDPAHGTTLGEMLFVLSLGSRESRERVLHDFGQELFHRVNITAITTGGRHNIQGILSRLSDIERGKNIDPGELGLRDLLRYASNIEKTYGNTAEIEYPQPKSSNLFPLFPGTVFGDLSRSDRSTPSTETLNPNQKEILSAIKTRAIENVAGHLKDLVDLDREARTQSASQDGVSSERFGGFYYRQALPLIGWLLKTQETESASKSEIKNACGCLLAKTGSNTFSTRGDVFLSKMQDDGSTVGAEPSNWGFIADQLANGFARQNALSRANPRVAAADDMIKRFITVYEGDLKYFMITPALERIRVQASKNAEFAGFQEETILASNRYVARVDVNASASLGTADVQPFVDVSSQLSAIQDKVNTSKIQSLSSTLGTTATLGVAAGASTNPQTSSLGDLGKFSLYGGLLGSLFEKPEPLGEVYSLNGGSQFKVTPIFDPSGQAMRFKFDHVETVRIQDPQSTTSPLTPRVDRHTINTEVQLSNGQFQIISSYDLNAKVGTPLRRTGGIPPFNHIWPFKEIPILGYYTTQKSAAVRQHSLIFASTIMYPTVGDIVNLLVDVPSSKGRSASYPEKKKEQPVTPDKGPAKPSGAGGGS